MNATVTTRGPYRRREAHYHYHKQEFSPKLKAMQEHNAEVNKNSKRVKHFVGVNYHEERDVMLIGNAIDHPIIG